MSGSYNDFLNALGFSESSNRYNFVSDHGYAGKYQLSEVALRMIGYYGDDGTAAIDWKDAWTGKNGIASLSDWLSNPAIQDKAAGEWFSYLWTSEFRYEGVQKYVGQTINGINVTESGLLAAAHLVGSDAVAAYLDSGGSNISKDPNGTTVENYLSKFAGYDVSPVTGTSSAGSSTSNPVTESPAETPDEAPQASSSDVPSEGSTRTTTPPTSAPQSDTPTTSTHSSGKLHHSKWSVESVFDSDDFHFKNFNSHRSDTPSSSQKSLKKNYTPTDYLDSSEGQGAETHSSTAHKSEYSAHTLHHDSTSDGLLNWASLTHHGDF
jgi:serralysin